MKTALISVYDKTGIADFAKELVALGWKIISSGGTAKYLSDVGIEVTDIAEITGMKPILSHRVLTLHPKIHGGLLALNTPEHLEELKKNEIPWIDMVCVDLYPLEEEINNPSATKESVIEKTDMGGVALIRSSAKGRRITICDKEDRAKTIEWLKNGEPNREEFINNLSAKAEALAAWYCSISGKYLSQGVHEGIFGEKVLACAYGENAYQKPASFYKIPRGTLGKKDQLTISDWVLIAGSPLSYNNICDLDRMLQTMTHIGAGFEKNFNKVPDVVIGAKHGNACGAGVGESGLDAVDKMLSGDLHAIFGGCVMLNFPVDEKIAEELIHKFAGDGRRLLDLVAAPSFTPEAIEILARKKGKCRILVNKNIKKAGLDSLDRSPRFRYVRGGFLTQPNYTFVPDMSKCLFDTKIIKDIILAWAVGCTSNSNTVTLVKDGKLLGNGVGQQDRVGAANLAILRAGDKDLTGAVAYSDSFFPFPDAPEVLINKGIKTIFSTSGSINDEKIVELCKAKGVNLIMLPDSEARGFYQH
ncbi:hypothetical protein A3A95_01225 [Candidatus Nomurabacteria bacterium RIFCSPLOWO2_01_FULL_39_18]|uniref:MGS-like domain-containing protein n=1 Tax=Candidatus Nomurabacteria bacterium RIFCSPHIGHO2_01_FULL_40_24b TaxID=1801739 RepID=A0A1F6V8L3_9BACT|nr:MAG: hypothetical protein A2647_00465 [Candidatus Nomurabacteria bacterium RIFCSPHIGHO2_01_FULL_40_24b]OGI88910.1 MAG: hypothetical protein A3A95_01225 [Candidatus Nomurabacteria bacterium RIFCSPLOWO2_01_FULL_39_18]